MSMLTTEVNMYGPTYFKRCVYPQMLQAAEVLAIIAILSDDVT